MKFYGGSFMADIKLGIQLYTLRDHIQTAQDFDATLKRLHNMGVRVIQISGIGPIDPQTTVDIVRKYDMDVCVTHKDFNRMLNDLDAMIDEHKLIDCDCMGIGGMPGEARESAEAVRAFIAKATEIGKLCVSAVNVFAITTTILSSKKWTATRPLWTFCWKKPTPIYSGLFPMWHGCTMPV